MQKKKQLIVLKVDEKVPKFIVSDLIRLQIIVNSFNAIKSSDEEARIHIESYDLTHTDVFHIKIVDEGIPFSDEKMKLIFKPYSILSPPAKSTQRGQAWGSRELIRKMDGENKLINTLDKRIGQKAYGLNFNAKVLKRMRIYKPTHFF